MIMHSNMFAGANSVFCNNRKYKKMKQLNKFFFATMVAFLISAPFSYAQEHKNGLTWHTDLNEACTLSNKTKKPIFAFFTGSDWCIWCHRMQDNVFAKQTFQEWANKHVILLELDFPRNKKLPDQLAQQNNSLQQFFKVQGFPTVWIFNVKKQKTTGKFDISALGNLGYPESEPGKEDVAFLQRANDIMKIKPKAK
jgi:thioredoxin-related protein